MTTFLYTDWLSHMATILQVSDLDGVAAMTALAPYFIERAEQMIYADADLDFLLTRASDVTKLTTRGVRTVAIPSLMITVEGVSLISPANSQPYDLNAQRIPMMRATRQFLDFMWPIESNVQAPSPLQGGYFAIFDFQQAQPAQGQSGQEGSSLPSSFLIAPTPDDTYRVEVTGTFRPAALSPSNTSTPLTTYYYPLFLAGTLVAAFAYQRDFGQSSDDPRTSVSWETEYQMQKAIAVGESHRQKALAAGGYSPFMTPMPMPAGGPMAPALRPGG